MQETMLEVVDLNSHRTLDFQIKLDTVKLSARSKRITIKDAKLKLPTMVIKVGRLAKYMNEKIRQPITRNENKGGIKKKQTDEFWVCF